MKSTFASLFLFVVLTGCAVMNRPTPEQISRADYGNYPINYQETIKNYMSRVLLDPYSAVYTSWRGPGQGYIYDFSGSYFGYRVCTEINAKNSMGGYVGSQLYFFIIRNAEVIYKIGGSASGTVGAEQDYNLCSSVYDSGPSPQFNINITKPKSGPLNPINTQ